MHRTLPPSSGSQKRASALMRRPRRRRRPAPRPRRGAAIPRRQARGHDRRRRHLRKPLHTLVDRLEQVPLHFGVGRGHHRHLVGDVRAQQGPGAQRPAQGVGDRAPRFLQQHRRGRHVVGSVVQHAPVPHGAEPPLDPGRHLDHARAHVDVGVQLPRQDARHGVGGAADVEDRAVDRRPVDQVAQDGHQLDGRTPPEADGPEQAGEVGVARQPQGPRRAVRRR